MELLTGDGSGHSLVVDRTLEGDGDFQGQSLGVNELARMARRESFSRLTGGRLFHIIETGQIPVRREGKAPFIGACAVLSSDLGFAS